MQKTEEILRYILHIFHNFANNPCWFVTINLDVAILRPAHNARLENSQRPT